MVRLIREQSRSSLSRSGRKRERARPHPPLRCFPSFAWARVRDDIRAPFQPRLNRTIELKSFQPRLAHWLDYLLLSTSATTK